MKIFHNQYVISFNENDFKNTEMELERTETQLRANKFEG